MWQRVLADVIVTVHFSWIAFVILGQLLILIGIVCRWPWIRGFYFRFVHLMMILLVALEAMFSVPCPLTVWEKRLRGLGPYEALRYTEQDSFIAHWLGELIFFDTGAVGDWPFVVAYVTFAALVVWSFLAAPPRLPMTPGRFMALVHGLLGLIFVTTLYWQPGIGVFFLIEAYVWYRLSAPPTPVANAPGSP